ncbi:hypothetical protein BH09GEM1_BH09GEM1_20710 [soil metagenome]
MRRLLALGMLYGLPLLAQGAARTVSPGMSKVQVVAALGQPAIARSVGEDTYLFYVNSCGRQCGMNDLVILHADSVSDAIFRSPDRHYTGKSSSPAAIPGRVAARAKAPSTEPRKTRPDSSSKAPRRMAPVEANDIRPSIPVKPLSLPPSPSTKPASKVP